MLIDLTLAHEKGYIKKDKRPRSTGEDDDELFEGFESPEEPGPDLTGIWLTREMFSDQACVYAYPDVFEIGDREYVYFSSCEYCHEREQCFGSSPEVRQLMNLIGEECEVKRTGFL